MRQCDHYCAELRFDDLIRGKLIKQQYTWITLKGLNVNNPG